MTAQSLLTMSLISSVNTHKPAVLKTGDPTGWETEVDFTQSITIVVTTNHQAATILEGDGVKTVQQGENIFEIMTKAEDGSTQKHYLYVSVKEVLSKDEMIVSQPLTVYPNPASEQVIINGLEGDGTLIVFDAAGRQYIRRIITSSQEIVDVNFLPRGIYIIQIVEGKNVRMIKLIVD